jgi:RNA polymerase sigma factor (TIGR02999 family)
MPEDSRDVAALVRAIVAETEVDAARHEHLYLAVYAELRRLAASLMRRERTAHTLQPTALVHEAYLKLVDVPDTDWQGRAHFFGAAARAMRQILVDHARRRRAGKRGGEYQRVTLAAGLGHADREDLEVIALHEALEQLATVDDRLAKAVELRVFAGLSGPEVARTLGVSLRTADQDWRMAKMWLAQRLATEPDR